MDLVLVMGAVIIVTFGVVVWLFIMMRKESQKLGHDDVVPITNIQELKKTYHYHMTAEGEATFEPATDPVSANPSADDDLQKAKQRLAELEKNIPVPEPTQEPSGANEPVEHSSISELKAPTSSVTTQKASNAAEARVRELELEIQRIKDKAVAQAEEALSAVEALSRENTELRAKLDGLNRDSAEELERELERLRLENRKLQEALDADQGQSSHFEEQVAAIKRQIGEELKSAQATIARLECDVLRWKDSHQSLATTQQDELTRVKGDYQEKIEDVKSQLTKLISSYQTLQMERDQMESKFALIDQELEDKVSGFQSKIEALNADLAALRAERDDMKLDLKKTKEFNAGLIEKNNILQYELTKSHAQSAGLNRICENFRTRVDELFEKVGSAEQQKKELTERQRSLEESLMAVEAEKNQLQAAEQKAKTALVQSETQISNLEKVYQEFRNRLKADGS